MTDLDLHLDAIRAGDQGAFASWLAGAERPVRASLRSFAAEVDVEAVLQEALLRAWQLAPRLTSDGRPNVLLRFTLVAARNLARSEVRRRSRLPPPGSGGGDDDEAGFERLIERIADEGPAPPDPLLRKLILACRDLLPPKPREALEARLAAGGAEPDQAIAARLGARLNTFLQNFTRARRLLAECLEAKGVALDEEVP